MVYSMSSRINVILSPDRNGMIVPYIIEKEGRNYRVDDVKQIRIMSGRQGTAKEKYLVLPCKSQKFHLHHLRKMKCSELCRHSSSQNYRNFEKYNALLLHVTLW